MALAIETSGVNGKESAWRRKVKNAGNPAVSRKTADDGAGIVTGSPVVALALDEIEVFPGNPEPDPAVVAEIVAHGQDEPAIVLAPGMLECPANVEITCDQTAYLLLAGASRLVAARQAGWPSLECRVRRQPLPLADAIAFALRNNTGRRVVTTAEKAGRVKQLADCGLGDTEIASRLDLDRAEVNQLRRFHELPEAWRARIQAHQAGEEDGLSWKAAKALFPYLDVPSVMADLETSWGEDYQRAQMQTDSGMRDFVRQVVADVTWDVTPGSVLDWVGGRYQNPPVRIPKEGLTLVQQQQLDVRELPVELNGKHALRACCDAETLLRVLGCERPQTDRREPGDGVVDDDADDGAGSAQKDRQETPAQRKAKDKAADAELAERITRPGGLAHWALRIACANASLLRPGKAPTRQVWRLLSALGRDKQNCSNLDPAQWIGYATQIWAKTHGVRLQPLKKTASAYDRPLKEDWAATFQPIALVDDPLTAHDEIETLACQLILWPQTDDLAAPGLYPSDVFPAEPAPWLDYWLLEAIAAELHVALAETWAYARDTDFPESQQWLAKFLAAHNRRQLVSLAEEIVRDFADQWDNFEKLPAGKMVAALQAEHADRGLTLPKILSGNGKKAKKGKGK
jgi:hypothetical protein